MATARQSKFVLWWWGIIAVAAVIVSAVLESLPDVNAADKMARDRVALKQQTIDQVQADLSACFEELTKEGQGCRPLATRCEEAYKKQIFGELSICLKEKRDARATRAKEGDHGSNR